MRLRNISELLSVNKSCIMLHSYDSATIEFDFKCSEWRHTNYLFTCWQLDCYCWQWNGSVKPHSQDWDQLGSPSQQKLSIFLSLCKLSMPRSVKYNVYHKLRTKFHQRQRSSVIISHLWICLSESENYYTAVMRAVIAFGHKFSEFIQTLSM